jgi:predicted glutamine amidotransferase
MCRLLAVQDSHTFEIVPHLRQLADIAKNSSEYQGDGWGCAWRDGDGWQAYRNIRPIWDDCLGHFGRTTVLLAHARSAFRNESLGIENNMPFIHNPPCSPDPAVFIFNGELRGVKLQSDGGIGAEKLFRFLARFAEEGSAAGVVKALEIVRKRSRYIRAMNFVLALGHTLFVHAHFNESPDYFTLHKKVSGTQYIVCSRPYPSGDGWNPLPNYYVEVHPF